MGVGLSVVLLYVGRSFLLTKDTVITFGMLFQPLLFVAALFFTLVLNVLSSGLPAFRIARGADRGIVEGCERVKNNY